jgi:hypothetical protein
MKALTSKKAIITILSVSSIVLAGTIKDIHSRSAKVSESAINSNEIIPVERNVASAASQVAQIYLPATAINIANDNSVAYDKLANSEDAKKSIKVKLELIGNGIVRINKDNEQVYRISLLSDFGTIALFKKLGNGYEIIEAKKIVSNVKTSLVVAEEVELVLDKALNPAKSTKVLEGQDVSGSVSINAKAITGLNVEIRNSNGEVQNIEIDTADLMDGGVFKADVNGDEVSGVVLNNGKDGYRISFVTGPIAGSMLNFVTKEEKEKIEIAALDNHAENQDLAAEEVKAASEVVVEERKEVANDSENYEEVQVLSAEQIKETAEVNGFAF